MNTNLASRLTYLTLDLPEKVLLWLTYKGLKPVSEISIIRRRNIKTLRQKGIKTSIDLEDHKTDISKIKAWLKDAGLVYVEESVGGTSWHISKDINLAKKSVNILHKHDFKSEVESGVLFGFPEKSAEAYALCKDLPEAETKHKIIWVGDVYNFPSLRDQYYAPYIFFSVSLPHLEEAASVAKIWADTIQQDCPKLAYWFESQFRRKASKVS